MTIEHPQDEASVLGRVQVRELREEERSEFDWRLEQQHYLSSSALVGESMRYVAEVDGQWVALIAFSAPALHIKGRERWIRWSARQRARRLKFVVNNSRYLVVATTHRATPPSSACSAGWTPAG